MNRIDIILIAIGLAMDSVTVAITKSLKENNHYLNQISFSFGLFQSIMLIIGYFIAAIFNKYIKRISNIVSFIILLWIGLSMYFKSNETQEYSSKNKYLEILLLSIATSIDSLSIGVSMSLTNTKILSASLIIGIITFILSYIATKIGNKIRNNKVSNSEKTGGILLIIIAFKILLKK